MGASHLEHATLSPPSLARTLFVKLCPTKRVDTGPSLYFSKYNCFSFDLYVYRLILNWHIGRVRQTDPRPSSPVVNFLAKNKLLFIKVSHVNFEVAWHFCENPGVIYVAMEICETDSSPSLRLVGCFPTWPTFMAPPSWILNSTPDWLKFVVAILDLENNRVYCSRNNSLLSFSAPDWLPSLWARYSSLLFM